MKRNNLHIQIIVIFGLISLVLHTCTMNNSQSGENPLVTPQTPLKWIEEVTWDWVETEVVSTESTDGSNWPSLAVDLTGNVHIAWIDYTDYEGAGTEPDIFYKYRNATSDSWAVTEVISTESTGVSYDPCLAVDLTGNVHIAWQDDTDYGGSGPDTDIFYKRWNATSGSWTTTEVVSTESTGSSSRPSLAVDSTGNVHIAWVDYTFNYEGSGLDIDIFYKYWNASSGSWAVTEVISTESTEESSRPSLAVDSTGNVHIAWVDITDYGGAGTDDDIFYKYWNASSGSWAVTEVISTESTEESSYPSLAVDPLGHAHIAWMDLTDYGGAGTDHDIFYKYWNAISDSWTPSEVISTESTGHSYIPSLAVDTAGQAHIAWYDNTSYGTAGSDFDIFYKYWNATRHSWTASEVVSTESTGASATPCLAVDSLAHVYVTWSDFTDYKGAGVIYNDIFYKTFGLFLESPTLEEIDPNPSTNGSIDLHWTKVSFATRYYIYRDTVPITSVSELTPLNTVVADTYYLDNLTVSGDYFYVVIAGNSLANSSISNCVFVEADISTENVTSGFLILPVIMGVVFIVYFRERRRK